MASRTRKHGKDTPPYRLKEARTRAGFSSSEKAAAEFGWSKSTYAHHESGVRKYGPRAAEYAEAFGVTVDWLLYGDAAPPPVVRRTDVVAAPASGTSSREVTAGGAVQWVQKHDDDDTDDVPFGLSLIERLGVDPDRCAVAEVDRDNATPDLPPGSTVMFDTSDRDTGRPGVFAVRSGTGRLAFLYLQYMVGTEPPRVHVTIKGDSPHNYDVPQTNLPVLGRIRWVGKIFET